MLRGAFGGGRRFLSSVSAVSTAALAQADFELLRATSADLRQVPNGAVPRARTLRLAHIASRHGDGALLDELEALLTTHSRLAVSDRALLTGLVAAHGRAGRPEAAQRLFEKMGQRQRTRPLAEAYGALIRSLRADPARALGVWRRMEEAHVAPALGTYNAMVDALARAGRIDDAHALLERMKERGTQPSVVTYTALVRACVRHGRPDLAADFYVEMRQRHIRPDAVALTTLLSAAGRAGRADDVVALLRAVRESGHADAVLVGAVVDAFARSGLLDRGVALLRSMIDPASQDRELAARVRVDPRPFTSIIVAYGRVRCAKEAMEIHDLAEAHGAVDARLLTSLLHALACSGAKEELRAALTNAVASPHWARADRGYVAATLKRYGFSEMEF
jgi:pentatricopeptide repeat protein